MTISPSVRSLVKAWWPVAAAVLIALWIAWRFQSARSAENEAARLAEAARLREQGLVVLAQESQRELRSRVDAMTRENAALAAELAKAQKAAKGSRVVGAVRASTGPVTAHGEAPAAPTQPEGTAAPSAPPCLLAEGDEAEIRVDQVMLSTEAGNRILVGTATAYRLHPLPQGPILSGAFSAPVTAAAEERAPGKAGWGAGVWTGVGRGGWAVGPAIALPPLSLWRFQIETVAGAGVGPGGEWQGGISAVVRFR